MRTFSNDGADDLPGFGKVGTRTWHRARSMRSDIAMDIHRQRGPVRSEEIGVADIAFKAIEKRIRAHGIQDAMASKTDAPHTANLYL